MLNVQSVVFVEPGWRGGSCVGESGGPGSGEGQTHRCTAAAWQVGPLSKHELMMSIELTSWSMHSDECRKNTFRI